MFLTQALGLDGEPDFIRFSRYLTMSLSVYNILVPFLMAGTMFIGILSDFTNIVQQLQTFLGTKWSDYKAALDYVFDPDHIWVIKCNTPGDGTCYLNINWVNYVKTYIIEIPFYLTWLGTFVVEHFISVIACIYYIYMTGFMSFDWLYTLARNV